jgi:tetratricopeptide (TPR) repeat protein
LAHDGKWDQATDAWQSALDDNPQNHAALHNLAIAALARGNHAQAATQLDKAIGIYADATYQRNRKLLAAQRQLAQTALAQSGSRPRMAPAIHEVGAPQPPQILPSTGSVIPAALHAPLPADNVPQRLPLP